MSASIHKAVQYLEAEITEQNGQLMILPHQDHASEPIAVIGMGCKFPAHANNPALFWQNLRNGIESISEVPASHRKLTMVLLWMTSNTLTQHFQRFSKRSESVRTCEKIH